MLKTKHKIILAVIAVIVALALLFFVGKEIAAFFAGVLAIFGFGDKALKKKADNISEKADQEKEVTEEVKNNVDNRQSKDEQLQQDDQKRAEVAEKLDKEDEDRQERLEKIENNQKDRKEKGGELSARLEELKGDDGD